MVPCVGDLSLFLINLITIIIVDLNLHQVGHSSAAMILRTAGSCDQQKTKAKIEASHFQRRVCKYGFVIVTRKFRIVPYAMTPNRNLCASVSTLFYTHLRLYDFSQRTHVFMC